MNAKGSTRTRSVARLPAAAARVGAAGFCATALLLGACGSEEPASPFAPTDPAGHLFEPDRVVEVAIDVDPGDWDELRRQSRSWWDVVAVEDGQCLAQPFPKPFTWFRADVSVDGVRREAVAVRKKGFIGSLNDVKPALKIRFDHYDPDQTLHGLERLTLNNSVQDPTYLRQCLAYRVFERAGIPVPWCNFAHVTVNGEDLGLYVHVESMDRRFVRRHFERDEGDLWEGEFSDFRAGWTDTFEKKGDVPDDDQTRVDRGALREVAEAVAGHVPDSQLRSRLEELVDFDGFMRFWAVEKILEHWDGYANNVNNYFLYEDPATGRFVFMPTGTDQITVPDPFTGYTPPVSVYAAAVLPNRLYAAGETRQTYAEALRAMLDRAFREEELLGEIDRMEALVTPVLARAGADTSGVGVAIDDLRQWVRGRRTVLVEDLENGPPPWRQPLKESICADLAGHVEGSFGTTFGTGGAPDIFTTGSGVLSLEYRRLQVAFRRVGAQAGFDRNAQADPWPVVDMNGHATDDTYYNVWIGVNPEHFRPGGGGPFDGAYAWGGIGNWNPRASQWTYLGGFVEGAVELEQAAAVPGAPVSGRFHALVIQW